MITPVNNTNKPVNFHLIAANRNFFLLLLIVAILLSIITKKIKKSIRKKQYKKTLVVIDIQNDITKNCKDIIGNINKTINWVAGNDIYVIYIRH